MILSAPPPQRGGKPQHRQTMRQTAADAVFATDDLRRLLMLSRAHAMLHDEIDPLHAGRHAVKLSPLYAPARHQPSIRCAHPKCTRNVRLAAVVHGRDVCLPCWDAMKEADAAPLRGRAVRLPWLAARHRREVRREAPLRPPTLRPRPLDPSRRRRRVVDPSLASRAAPRGPRAVARRARTSAAGGRFWLGERSAPE